MASPLDEVGAYDPEGNPRAVSLDAPPPPPPPTREDVAAGLDNQEQQLLSQLPNTSRGEHRQVADQIAGVRFQRRQLDDSQRKEQTQNRLKAKDLADRGIPTFRNASGGVSPVTDEGGSPLTHYDPAHDIAYDSAGNAKVVSYDSTAGPPALKDPFENIPVQTDRKTGEQYQKRPGLAWNWVGTDPDVKSARMQEGKDKAVAKEAALIGQKLSIDHADLVAGEKEHNVMTKELQAAVPTLQDPKYAGANRDAVLAGIDEHFNSEYARPEANATNGWFSKDLAPSAQKLRADIDARKADAIDKANGLFDLKEHQIELGDQVSGERDQRKAEIETLLAHGRGQAGPLDQPQGAASPAAATPAGNEYPVTREGNIDTNVPGGSVQDALEKMSPGPGWSYNGSTGQWSPPTTPQDVHAAAQSGNIPMQVAPAALAAAHDAQDANAKADALQESNPGLAGQFKAVAQGILHGLATGISDIVKGAPGILKMTAPGQVLAAAAPTAQKALEGQYSKAGEAIQNVAENDQSGYDKALAGTIGGHLGNFAGGVLPFVGASLIPGGQAALGARVAVHIPTVLALFSAGYGATKEDALKHGADPETAETLANASGAVNGILALPFKGVGQAISRVFGGKSPEVIKEAIETAFKKEGPAGAAKLIDGLRGFVERNEKPVIGNVAQDVRGQVVRAIDSIKGEMLKSPAERAATVAKHMASAGAMGAGVQTAQNIIAQQYDPERGTFEGVPENALGFALLAGVSHGFDQVVTARRAKQALDLLRPGEEGPPAVRGQRPAGPTPPPQGGAGPSEKPVSGRVVEPTPTEGEQNVRSQQPAEGQIQQAPPTGQPARREGAPSEPVNADASGATAATGQAVTGRNEPGPAGQPAAPGQAGAITGQETAKPTAVSGVVRDLADKLIAIEQRHADNPDKSRANDEAFAAVRELAPKGMTTLGTKRDVAAKAVLAKAGFGSVRDLVNARKAELGQTVDQAAHEAATSPTNALPEPTQGQQKAGNYQKGHIVQLGGAGGINVTIENPVGSQRSNLDTTTLQNVADTPAAKNSPAGGILNVALESARHGDYIKARQSLENAADDLRLRNFDKLADSVQKVSDTSYATPLQSHYGYIKGTVGADKDHVDVFVKPGTPTNYSGPVYVVDQTHPGGEKFHHGGALIANGGKFDEHKAIIGAGSHEEAIAEYQKNYDPDHQGNYSGVTEFQNIGEFKQWLDSGNKGPAAESKDVALHPTDEHQRGVEKRVIDRMLARQDVLGALSHPTTPRVGRTSNPSGIETIVTDGTGQITIDPGKLARATRGMPERQQSKFIDRAIDEEILHVAQQEWVNHDPKHEGLIRAWGAEKDELDAHMASAYAGWERLNDRQKGFEKQRAVLQKRWTGKLSEAAYQALQAFIRFLRTIWDKLSDDQRKSVEDVESIMKGQEPVTAPEGFETYKGKHGDTKIRAVEPSKAYPKVVDPYGKTHTIYGYGIDAHLVMGPAEATKGGASISKGRVQGSGWEWYALEPVRGDIVHRGFVHGHADEFGSFSLSELKDAGVRFVTDPQELAGIAAPIGWKSAEPEPYRVQKPTQDIRKTPPATEFDRRRARRQQLEQRVKDLGESVPATLQTVLRTLLTSGPKREPSVLQLDQAERKLNQIGGENAITTGEKPKGGQPEHSGVSSGENIPAHGSEVRDSESEQTGGRGEPVKRPTSPEPRPKAEATAPEPGRAGTNQPVVSDSKLPTVAVPDDVAQALRDLAEGLGAAAPKPEAKPSLKMSAIYHAITVKGHSVEKVAKDFAMPPKIIEQIYDKMTGVRLGAAAPAGGPSINKAGILSDKQGKPITMYHGTNREGATKFGGLPVLKIENGKIVATDDTHTVWWTSDKSIAESYGGHVVTANLVIKKPAAQLTHFVSQLGDKDGAFSLRDDGTITAVIKNADQISLGAAAPIVQKQLPKEKRAAALAAADKLVAAGFDTPEKFAGALAAVPALHPYAQSIWDVMAATGDVLRGTHDFNALLAPKEPKSETVADLHPITAAVQERMIAGKPMPRAELTALAEQHGVATKEADELAEAGVVRAARQVVQNAEGQISPVDTYDKLVKMYENQPNLSAKTATSKLAQAFSTPIPIAYVASRLADISGGKIIYEPTAGNGALLIESNPDAQTVHANELNPTRAAQLKSQGFKVTSNDATNWRPQVKADRMIENPPFGVVKDDNGDSKKFDVLGVNTTLIDHAITLASLEALADDGRAVLIVGGPGTGIGDVISDDTKREKYYYEGQRGDFWKKLYADNRVIDHFTIEGDLYEKQGAGWPIDIVVIAGVGPSPIRLPSANAPRIISSWDELRNELGRTDEDRITAGKLSEREATEQVSGAISGIRDIVRSGEGPGRPRPGSPVEGRPVARRSDLGSEVSPAEQSKPVTTGGTEASAGSATGPAGGAVTGELGGEHEQRGQLGVEGEAYPEPELAKYRVKYKPKSNHPSFGIFTPTNLEHPQQVALKKVADAVGDIDAYVREKLGYTDKEAKRFKEDYFSAEQIDTLALAIHAAENGSAFITGDQGGVGKGRIAAGMMLYAIRKGWIPVFMTRDEKLYAAMLEDLDDIGRGNLVPTFSNNGMRFEDHRKQVWRTGNQSAVMESIRDNGRLPENVDLLFTSYYQVQNDVPRGWRVDKATRATLKARKIPPPDGPKMEALKRIAPNALFIMDESHEASGDSIRAWRLEPLLKEAPAAYYSSATFAKRPDSIGIYFRTTLSHAAPTMQELIEALSVGGVPLQQASISMLADDGLYMRRERDFGNSTFNTHINLESADRDKELADSYTAGLRKILGLSNKLNQVAEHINGIIKGKGKRLGATNSPRLESTNFAAVIHNLVSQYLLSIKTKATVERAIEHIKEGRRVVVTVQNTMESAIRSLRASGLPLTFNGLLQRLLEQQRTLKTRGRNPEEFYISDEPDPEFEQYSDKQLEGMLVSIKTDEEGKKVAAINAEAATEYFRRQSIQLINETKLFVDGIELGDMPLSPIDAMRHAMEDVGYKTAEITGRGIGLNRAGEVYDIKGYEHSKKAQLGYMRDFNDGDVQFLVMNASGSTGISLHASKKFKNQNQRAMLVVQPHLDINQFMQSLWRIDRTGQMEPPFFEVIQTAIPAELRPAAVRERKMASLNANTTSNAKNEMRAQDLDIFNEFGDEVVYQYLLSDPGFVTLLQWEALLDKNGNLRPFDSFEMEAGKLVAGVTGRLAILPTSEGEEFWNRVNEEYRALIQHLDDTGQNTLKVAAIDMRAETLDSKQFTAGNPTGDSAFDGPSTIEHVKAQVGKAPRMGEEVLDKANEVQRDAPETMRKWESAAESWYRKELDRRVRLEASFLTEAEKQEAQTQFGATDTDLNEREYALRTKMSGWVTRMNNAREEISNSLRLLGETVHIHSDRGLDVYGAVVEAKLDEEHPLTPSKQEFNVWVNSTMRQIRFSAAQLSANAKTTPRDHFVDAYEETAERSNERYIITGNLLAASVSLAGQVQNQRIIVYTDDKGVLKQGILLPVNFNPNTFVGREEVQGADHFKQLLEDGRTVTNRNQALMIMKKAAGTYEIRIPASKQGGGKFWSDHTLRSQMNNQDFVQKGSQMVGTFGSYYLPQVYQTITNDDRLGTQLFFNRPVSDSGAPSPTALGAAAPKFARDYWSEDVKPILANANATMHEVVDAAVHVLSPTYGVNKDVVDQVHKLLGERNQAAYVVDRTGEAFEHMFRSMPRPDQITFIDRVKTGDPQPTPELEQAARFIRGVDSGAWQALSDAATSAGFKESPVKWLENHYRVMWKTIPGSVNRQSAPGSGRGPLRGSRGMAKEHTLNDMSEGIERGGIPFSYNPITNLKMALADIWKYTTALKMWAWAKENGFVSFVRGPFPKLPEGMTWLNDSIADVWFPAESGEGLIHAGKYAVDPGFGRLINNFLSRDLIRQTKTGRGLLWIKNATTALELALSLFHGVFETGEVVASNIGLGLSKLYNRGLLQKDTSALMSGIMDILKAPSTFATQATLGSQIRKAAGNPDEFFKTPEGAKLLKLFPRARQMIDDLFSGGWKPNEVEADWKNKSVNAFMDAWADLRSGTSNNYIGAGLRAFPAANEFLMKPLFDVYIPNLKVAQFFKEYDEALKQADAKYPNGYYIDRSGRRYDRPSNGQLARQIWRLVEDRFGELNYDTLFWNNTFKSAMQLMFRSVTWKLGSVEAFAGAFGGQGKEFVNAFKERRAPELHRNAAWLLGIFLLTAAVGTIIQKVFAGKDPKSLTDLVFPQIDPRDDKVRVSIPTYFKDLVHLVHSPTGYVKASLAGWIGRVADLLSNKDYYGVQIRNDDDPATKQALQMGRYAAQSILPFSIRGYKNLSQSQENTVRKSMAWLGINPAPRYIGQTPAEQQVEKYWKGQRTEEGTKPEQYETQKGKREIVSKIRHGSSPDISGALARGTIKAADIPALYKRAQMGQLASSIDRMPLADAEKVFARANPTERAQLAGIIARKRANSLRRSGRTMYAGF